MDLQTAAFEFLRVFLRQKKDQMKMLLKSIFNSYRALSSMYHNSEIIIIYHVNLTHIRFHCDVFINEGHQTSLVSVARPRLELCPQMSPFLTVR